MRRSSSATLTKTQLAKLTADPRLLGPMKSLVTLMAALECPSRSVRAGQAIELLEIAFIEMMELRDLLRRQGFALPLFSDKTPEQMRKATLRYALGLRNALSVEDWAALDDARMTDLR